MNVNKCIIIIQLLSCHRASIRPQFFLSPLFTESATEREVNAVNSEHEKNIPNDTWRINQIEKATADPAHDFSKFGTGNKETLDTIPRKEGLSVRDSLLEFHNKWYSSNIMGLAVLGREDLNSLQVPDKIIICVAYDKDSVYNSVRARTSHLPIPPVCLATDGDGCSLQEMTLERFSEVEDKAVDVPEWVAPPFSPPQCATITHIVPVKDIRNLNITWGIPDLTAHYQSCPGSYLGHLIGHEGPGSLLSELKVAASNNTRNCFPSRLALLSMLSYFWSSGPRLGQYPGGRPEEWQQGVRILCGER